MTQRIFDVEDAKDMADLWDILPDNVDTMRKINRWDIAFLANGNGELRISSRFIKINWHDKTEITRPIQEATEADLDKLCYFWDNCCEDIIIGKLTVVERNKGHTYYRLGNYAVFDHCRRLTKQEIEELC